MDNDIGLNDLAHLVAPDTPVSTVSNPEPALKDYNVVGVFHDQDDSRDAVLAMESIEIDDAALGLLTFGSIESPRGMQPQDRAIVGETLRRTAKGAAIGAVIGALLVGLGALAFSGSDAIGGAAGGAIGGALFGAFLGGLWGAFVRFGGSDAYRQSYTPDRSATTLVSLHTDSPDHAQEARRRMASINGTTPTTVRRDGRRLWAEPA